MYIEMGVLADVLFTSKVYKANNFKNITQFKIAFA